MDKLKNSGVYKITNIINNKIYIGSSVNLKTRIRCHINELKKNKHKNKYLQSSWNKYGEKNFEFKIIEYVEDILKIIEREQYWLDFYKPYDAQIGYNHSPTAGSSRGIKLTEERKQKISDSSKGGNNPRLGSHLTEEEKKHLSKVNQNKKLSQETIKKIQDGKKNKLLGENSHYSKLKENEVIKIKKLIKDNIPIKIIAEQFGVIPKTIRNIKNNKTWNYIDENGNIDGEIIKDFISVNDIVRIKKMLKMGISQSEIAKFFNLSVSAINNYALNKTRKDIKISENSGIRHIGLVTKRIDKMVRFYDYFGFKQFTYKEFNTSLLEILNIDNQRIETYKLVNNNDDSVIELLYYPNMEVEHVVKNIYDIGISHIALTVENIDKVYSDLKDTVNFISAPLLSPFDNVKLCFCQDPDQNFIELVEDLPKMEELDEK